MRAPSQEPMKIGSVDVEQFSRNLARVVEEGGRALAAYLKPRELGRDDNSEIADEINEVVKTLGHVAQYWMADPQRTIELQSRLGKAYLDFARREPAYYSAMFEAGIPLATNPELREAGDRAFAVLRGAADKLCAQAPARNRPPALMVALHIWAMSHGIASLFGRGDAARRALPMSPEELLEAEVLVYLRGLGVAQPKPGAA